MNVNHSDSTPLVNCFFIGAPKCGTSTLYSVFTNFADCCVPRRKEPHYFSNQEISGTYYDSYICRSIKEYHGLFSPDVSHRLVIDFSPSYLVHANTVAERILDYNPNARLVAILRNPTERALSHYLMDIRLGYLSMPFLEAIKDGPHFHEYIANGVYSHALPIYKKHFGENLLVLGFEGVFMSQDTLAREALTEFLELDKGQLTWDTIIANRENSYWAPRFQRLMPLARRARFAWNMLPRSIRSMLRPLVATGRKAKPDVSKERAWLNSHYDDELERLKKLEGGRYSPIVERWASDGRR